MVFDNKHIVVFGGTAGIGKTTALNLANKGAKLTIVGRNENRLSDTLNELKVQNPNEVHLGYISDLVDYAAVKLLVAQLEKTDGIVYSAGIQKIAP